jgi:hypothetical protein
MHRVAFWIRKPRAVRDNDGTRRTRVRESAVQSDLGTSLLELVRSAWLAWRWDSLLGLPFNENGSQRANLRPQPSNGPFGMGKFETCENWLCSVRGVLLACFHETLLRLTNFLPHHGWPSQRPRIRWCLPDRPCSNCLHLHAMTLSRVWSSRACRELLGQHTIIPG